MWFCQCSSKQLKSRGNRKTLQNLIFCAHLLPSFCHVHVFTILSFIYFASLPWRQSCKLHRGHLTGERGCDIWCTSFVFPSWVSWQKEIRRRWLAPEPVMSRVVAVRPFLQVSWPFFVVAAPTQPLAQICGPAKNEESEPEE